MTTHFSVLRDVRFRPLTGLHTIGGLFFVPPLSGCLFRWIFNQGFRRYYGTVFFGCREAKWRIRAAADSPRNACRLSWGPSRPKAPFFLRLKRPDRHNLTVPATTFFEASIRVK